MKVPGSNKVRSHENSHRPESDEFKAMKARCTLDGITVRYRVKTGQADPKFNLYRAYTEGDRNLFAKHGYVPRTIEYLRKTEQGGKTTIERVKIEVFVKGSAQEKFDEAYVKPESDYQPAQPKAQTFESQRPYGRVGTAGRDVRDLTRRFKADNPPAATKYPESGASLNP